MKLLFENKKYLVSILLTILMVFCTHISGYADENSAPVFTDGDSTTRSIAENTASGVNIGSVIAATDADNDVLTYTLGGTDASAFRIVSTSGQLQTNVALDYETKTSYSVSVSVSDGNGGSDSIAVTINVTDLNKKPSFNIFGRVTLSVAENTAPGTNIGTPFQATDPDSGDTLTYSLQRDDKDAFSINENTGQLQTRAALDYETKSSYSNLAVRVTDSEGLVNSVLVTINVTDVNETPANSAPTFTDGTSTTRSVAENTRSGTNIGGPVAATDADNDTLTYTLGGTDASSFSIVSTSGQLRTNAALDYETKTSYSVTVSVSDGNGGSDSIVVTISVTDDDKTPANNAPSFTDGTSTTRSVAENTRSGRNIGSPVAATDADTGNTLTYTLSGTDAASFSIVSTSGQLQTNVALDYETKTSYSVSVSASDSNGGSDSIAVTINVTNVNEKPSFSISGRVTLSIAENTTSGTNIGTPFQATDPDSGDTLTYSLQRGDKDAFRIDANTGQMQTRAALDYETKRTYNDLAVRATDSTGLAGSTLVTINVTDVDENNVRDVDENNAPVFTDGSSTTRSIAENTASGQNIGSAVAATDADGDTLSYTLGGTDAASFSIVSTTGQLQTNAALDYETKNAYSVTVSVSDGNGGSDSTTVTINITNVFEKPSFPPGGVTLTVAENTASGTNIGTPFQATDPDSGDTLTYSLQRDDKDAFRIDANTGQLQTHAALDYETKNAYTDLAVRATDSTGLAGSTLVTINVTDVDENNVRDVGENNVRDVEENNAPVFTDGSSTTRSIAENTASGQNIGTAVAATDSDNDTLTYSLGGTDTSSFSIVNTTGQLQTSAALNYEIKSSYSVTVSVSDGNGGSDSIAVTINVTDVIELIPPLSERTPQVRDAIVAAAGVNSVGDVTDSHLAAITVLNLSNQSISSLKAGDFNGLTALTGLNLYGNSISDISALSNLTALTGLNLGANSISDISALSNLTALETLFLFGNSVSDISALSNLTALETLNLYDNSISDISALSNLTALTSLSLYNNSVSDISALSNLTALETLFLTYNSVSDISALSNLTALTGLYLTSNSVNDISALSNLTALTQLRLSYNSVSDISALSNLTALTSLFLTSNSVSDISALSNLTALTGLYLTSNSVSDISALSNLTALTQLRLSSNSISDVSALEGLTSLDYLYLRGNQISDYGPLRRFKAANPDVSIDININNNPPVFTDSTSITRSIAENTASGQNIGSAISATDADDHTLTYRLSGTDASSFSIVRTSGQLQTNAALDYETKNSYSVTVNVYDGNSGGDSIDVTINVTKINEGANNAPVFTDGTTRRTVAENTASGTNIGSAVSAIDADNDTLTYTLGGTDASSFSIVSTSGQLRTSAALDYETKTSYSVTVSASDGNGGSDSITVTINVIDVQEGFLPVNQRTQQVQDAIVAAIEGVDSADNVTEQHLATITTLNPSRSIASLKSGDFDGLTALTTLNLFDSKFTVLPPGIFDGLTALTTLDLSSGYFTTLPSGIFDGLTSLTTLDLSSGYLTSLPSGVFDGLTALTTLDLEGANPSNLTTLPSGIFDELTALTTLKLHGNKLASLPSGVFDGLTSLITLNLWNNKLTSLPSGIFDGLTSLTTLKLHGNKLTSLSSGVFDKLTALTTLDLKYNKLTSLSSGVFDGLIALTTLDLFSNELTSLSSGVFDGLTALTTLDLRSNKLPSLPSGVFDELTALTTLDLWDNKFTSLPSGVFNGLTSLKTLDLTYFHLTLRSLPSGVFDGLTSLETLYLRHNRLRSLPSGVFDDLTSLTTLKLHNTELTTLPSGVFDKLTALQTLELQASSLRSLSSGVFDKLTALETLNLLGNNLTSLESDVFDELTALTTLNLSDNDLTTLPSGVFDELTALKTLNLYANSINDVSELENLTWLTKLIVSENPILDYGPLRRLKAANSTIDIAYINLNNSLPVFTDGDTTTRTVIENTASGQNIGAPVSATDANRYDDLTYTLGGTDAAAFDVGWKSGQLLTKAALDFETKNSYTVTVTAYDGNSGADKITVTINVTDVAGAAPSLETSPVIPDNTALLTNFPNPFNPETWIPYQLANPAEVTLTIYDIRGRVVRRLALGHQPAGFYQSRSQAAHWDGRNQLGEKVATGVYFYTLKAGDYTATRKLLIRK